MSAANGERLFNTVGSRQEGISCDETRRGTEFRALVAIYVRVEVCQLGRTACDGCCTNGAFQRADDNFVSTFGRCGCVGAFEATTGSSPSSPSTPTQSSSLKAPDIVHTKRAHSHVPIHLTSPCTCFLRFFCSFCVFEDIVV